METDFTSFLMFPTATIAVLILEQDIVSFFINNFTYKFIPCQHTELMETEIHLIPRELPRNMLYGRRSKLGGIIST